MNFKEDPMVKTIDDTLLPRPPQLLDLPALAAATRRASERLQDQFNLTEEGAEAFATAAVDPSELRKAAENPEKLYVPGGTLLGLRTRVWTRRVMPDPRNPRVGPARRHPAAVTPGSTEETRYRPIPEPEPYPDSRPQLQLQVGSRDHLSWAAAIAKKYILKDNDWRLSIRNQGVMTEVWLSAVTLLHDDGSVPVTVPVTSEGSSRLTACHDILDIRSSDVPYSYSRDDRALRAIIRSLNEAYTNGPSVEQAEHLRCETIPALLLVGFEPNPGATATFATAVRSLVALRHVDYPKPWDEAAKMESIADAVLEALLDHGLVTAEEETWLAGGYTAEEAEYHRFSGDPAVRAAHIVRVLTDPDPVVQQTVRAAITSQSTRQRVTNKFKLQVAAALIMRSVRPGTEREKVTDIHRALRDGFADVLANSGWDATYRPNHDLVAEAAREADDRQEAGPASLELAARAAYPLIVSRQLLADQGTQHSQQVDRRNPGVVIDRMRASRRGVFQLGQALSDFQTAQRIRAVGEDGAPIHNENGVVEVVSDNWLRSNFPPPGRPVAPPAPETAHERLLEALAGFGAAMDRLNQAADRLARVDGIDGRPLIDSEGVDPADADEWWGQLMQIAQRLPVWKALFIARNGQSPTAPAGWEAAVAADPLDEFHGEDGDPDEDEDVEDLEDEDADGLRDSLIRIRDSLADPYNGGEAE